MGRYFSDGMSYGGLMSETIACQCPDLFRAIGSMSGSMFGSTRSRVASPSQHGSHTEMPTPPYQSPAISPRAT
jgi:poly(3-hydroxybutyrate) depolymerase